MQCPLCSGPLHEVFFGNKITFRCWRCMGCQGIFTEEEIINLSREADNISTKSIDNDNKTTLKYFLDKL